jgi:ABC-2 type transport system permease protein
MTRPLYWSIRRELWEHRAIVIAPLVVAAIVLFGTSISVMTLPHRLQHVPTADVAKLRSMIVTPFLMAPAPIMLATFLIGLFYSLDALYGERRDRSVLFWKSLPVSDRATVLSKAAIPLVVLPVIGIVLGFIAQFILLVFSSMIFAGHGMSAATSWAEVHFFQQPFLMVYGVGVHILWFAPIYAWLLLISAWAKKSPLLWAVLPPLALCMAENMFFKTVYFAELLQYRVMGAMSQAYVTRELLRNCPQTLADLDPIKYLGTPGLWLGLIFAAVFLYAAARFRRNREPI